MISQILGDTRSGMNYRMILEARRLEKEGYTIYSNFKLTPNTKIIKLE
jgi:hypothetical protein